MLVSYIPNGSMWYTTGMRVGLTSSQLGCSSEQAAIILHSPKNPSYSSSRFLSVHSKDMRHGQSLSMAARPTCFSQPDVNRGLNFMSDMKPNSPKIGYSIRWYPFVICIWLNGLDCLSFTWQLLMISLALGVSSWERMGHWATMPLHSQGWR